MLLLKTFSALVALTLLSNYLGFNVSSIFILERNQNKKTFENYFINSCLGTAIIIIFTYAVLKSNLSSSLIIFIIPLLLFLKFNKKLSFSLNNIEVLSFFDLGQLKLLIPLIISFSYFCFYSYDFDLKNI